MADQDRALLDEVFTGAHVMATLAQDEEVFRAVVDAFRAYDGESMAKLLARHELSQHCEVVCHWLRSKETVILCLELAGPPPEREERPDAREFAEVVAKLTADDDAVRLMIDAVEDRDVSAWRELISRHGIERFSHLLCHWVSTVHHRLVCHVVCSPIVLQRPHLGPELRYAGAAVAALAADERTFAKAEKAVLAGRCEAFGSVLELGGTATSCRLVCEWFCSWRCTLACLRFCRIHPMIEPRESWLAELREFALATGKLDKAPLERLSAAFLREDEDLVQSLVKEWHFERFCILFCHWVCFLRCHRFCVCVCPPRTTGVFTKIGAYYYDTDVDSHHPGDGLTLDTQKRAFYATLRLNGGLSLVDGAPLIEYRFQTRPTDKLGASSAAWANVEIDQIASTNIGSFVRQHPTMFWLTEVKEVWVNKPTTAGFDITPDGDGWMKVPPLYPSFPMVSGTGWRFVPGSDLIKLVTTAKLAPVQSVDETGVDAGEPAIVVDTDVHLGIRMMIRDQGTAVDGVPAGTCEHITVDNSEYDKVSHHPYWPGGLFGAGDELAVASIGIDELSGAACSPLTTDLTVKFTAAHPHLGDVSVTLEGPPLPSPSPAPVFALTPGPGFVAGVNECGEATPVGWTPASLAPCAYLVRLTVQVLLTDGDNVPGTLSDYIAFCKAPTRRTK
jgi:hypothetical protein